MKMPKQRRRPSNSKASRKDRSNEKQPTRIKVVSMKGGTPSVLFGQEPAVEAVSGRSGVTLSNDDFTSKTNSEDPGILHNLNSLKNIVILESKHREPAANRQSVARLSEQYMTRSQANVFLSMADKRLKGSNQRLKASCSKGRVSDKSKKRQSGRRQDQPVYSFLTSQPTCAFTESPKSYLAQKQAKKPRAKGPEIAKPPLIGKKQLQFGGAEGFFSPQVTKDQVVAVHSHSLQSRKKQLEEDVRQPASQLFSPKLTLFSNRKSVSVLKIKRKDKASDETQGRRITG